MEIAGRRILVTGASRGIGRALAERLARDGARLVLVARSAAALEEVAAATGGRAWIADLADPAAVDGLVERVEADGGGVDVLVNNAGISNVDHVLNHGAADIEAIFRTNLLTPVHLCRQVIPRMLARGGGHIVNVSSLAAVLTPPGLVHYGASKAGLSHYTAGLRQDLRGLPIGLTLVEIGSVPTELDAMSRRYPPLRAMVERTGGRGADLIPMEAVVDGIAAAIRRDARHVRLPRALAVLPMLVELPRRLSEMMFRRVDPRPPGLRIGG
jgi:short-subunit dehydrogenase